LKSATIETKRIALTSIFVCNAVGQSPTGLHKQSRAPRSFRSDLHNSFLVTQSRNPSLTSSRYSDMLVRISIFETVASDKLRVE